MVTEGHDPLRTAAAAYLHCPTPTPCGAVGRRRAHGAPSTPTTGCARGARRPGRQLLRFGSPLPSQRVSAEIRWGIVGPGRIAENVCPTSRTSHARPVAVASRSQERADAFAARHGLDRAHGSYDAILADPDVDVLYVATPHPQHHALALAALRAGKALLVEKSFTATTAGPPRSSSWRARPASSPWRRCGRASSRRWWRCAS